MPVDPELLKNPDAVLLEKANTERLIARLTAYTVPLFFFRSGADRSRLQPNDLTGSGSGVLAKIDHEHHFILTAGHCVRDYRQAGACAVGVSDQPHRYAPSKSVCDYVFKEEGGPDFGFICVPRAEVSNFEGAGCRVFASPPRLAVMTREQMVQDNDWQVLAGYPDALRVRNEHGEGTRLLTYSTTVAGTGQAPQSTMRAPSFDLEYIDLWVGTEGQVNPIADYAEVKVPILRSTSGGGCWKAGVRKNQSKWNEGGLCLAGVHIASTDDGEERFAREVAIGHHLRLIAETMPQMKATIFRAWPHLEDRRWLV